MGVRLSLTDNRKEALEAAIPQIVRPIQLPGQLIHQPVEKFGALDGAANLAGVVHKTIGISGITQLTNEEWSFVTGINLTGVFYATRAQLQAMEKLGCGGSIVNAASTAGIEGLTRSAAKEVGRRGVRVNAIAPGVIDTYMVQTLPKAMNGGVDWLVQHQQALGRRAQPLEIAKLIAFLLSDESSFTTGAIYVADRRQVC
ncbi:hypothetical protein BCR34DRAFT_621163 [Clohesyomyces aquaticus]|uniref:3-oxoacyl-reductase n=1 Tax=Clohesyomyces aquaticus TaxID=1231657 RepID=A0A1Y2A9K1_9PLEO|nr:hypothetical protein BCR34DRAFT_621163 [Clohesyomyces aquaticus]